jgi:hypothetical protein
MQINDLPTIVQNSCNQFVDNFKIKEVNFFQRKLKHNGIWKESDKKLCEIAKEILNTL